MNLLEKVILVTGASGDIGSAIAKVLAEKGSKIVLHYSKDLNSVEKLGHELDTKKVDYLIVKANFEDINEINEMFLEIKTKYLKIDGLINVSGIENVSDDPLNTKDWQQVFAINLFGAVECSRYALEMMQDGGVIINISSVAGNSGTAFTGGSLSYAVSKAALNKFSEELSLMIAPSKRVVTISPGYTLTKMWNPFSEAEKKEAVEAVPLKRFVKPEEIAHTVIAVLENDAITGQNLIIDGGLSIKDIK